MTKWRVTPAQADTLDSLIRFGCNKRVSTDLGISERTAENHVAAVLRRTGIANRTLLLIQWDRFRNFDSGPFVVATWRSLQARGAQLGLGSRTILRLAGGPSGTSIFAVSEALGVSAPEASSHLGRLVRAGYLQAEGGVGRRVYRTRKDS